MGHEYLTGQGTRATPQDQPIPGTNQVPNEAGGYAWELDKWARLRRFLVLGAEGGTYYASERDLARENVACLHECLAEDPAQVVNEVVDISTAGRAPKNDPALFALAAASKGPRSQMALEALPKVARIGTHLFHYAQFVEAHRGWGRSLARAVAAWYQRPVGDLAYQVVKYRQRDGWTHRDLLRLSHPKPPTDSHKALYDWICGRPNDSAPPTCQAFDEAQQLSIKVPRLVELIRELRLPREAIPTDQLTKPEVWEALLSDMPMTAMIRNLATMTRVGLLAPFADAVELVGARLTDAERLRTARVHPIQVLSALVTYQQGRGARGQHTWQPVPKVVDALDAAFYAAFGAVEPTNKRTMLALDVSGSMGWGEIAGVPGLTPRVGAAAMALVTAAVEPAHFLAAFSHEMVPVTISPRQRLDDVVNHLMAIPMGGTDCALPMLAAAEHQLPVDTFIVYTDNETWAGSIHPAQALARYRAASGIPARLVVVGMTSNGFTIADPNDAGMLDVVGFDTAAPGLISDFSAGRL